MLRALGVVTFSRLMKLAREIPGAREFRLARVDYVNIARKEPTLPTTPRKPEDAGPDWTPPAIEAPAFFRFAAGACSVTVKPDDALKPGQVDAR